MENLGQREKILLVITVIALVIFIAWNFGLESMLTSGSAGSSDVAQQERRFNQYLDDMEDILVIESEFARVGEFPSSDDGELRPALAFTQQVSQMCRDLGFDFPSLRPQVEPIDGIEEYELINVALKTEGSWEDTVNLLKTFEQNGLIFRELNLRSTADRPIVVATMVVARIAEKPEQQRGILIRRR